MNDMLSPFLCRFVLVFFDNILIYKSWSEHLQHIDPVFTTLRAHGLFLKRSKCSFKAPYVAYLGHVISTAGVPMDSDKVAAVTSWLMPHSLRGVQGFLGIPGYYRKFIHDFGSIAAPLTRLLWKEAFIWRAEADEAFAALKWALLLVLVLQMTDFECAFVVDCEASGMGFGVVLHQGADPWPSSVYPLALAMSSWRPMSVSSSDWCKQSATSARTSGGAVSSSAPTNIA